MRERLVSYLLGELDASDAAALEDEIDRNPELAKQLERLRECLLLEQAGEEEEPPSGLADRTAESVHDLVLGLESGVWKVEQGSSSSGAVTVAPAAEPPAKRSSFTLVDATVAGGVIMALGMMLFPALRESREASRRNACTNNLYQIGQLLEQFATQNRQLFPQVLPGENAGVYTVRLAEERLVERDDLARLIVCRASPLGEQAARRQVKIRIPTADELQREKDVVLLALHRKQMGGSYAYRLGYLDGGRYRPISNSRSSRAPMLSDAPKLVGNQWRSFNHGGCGQNVLFQDGSVSYRVSCFLQSVDDNFFLNSEGRPAAGRRWNDAVLVRSEVTPGVLPKIHSAALLHDAVTPVTGGPELRLEIVGPSRAPSARKP